MKLLGNANWWMPRWLEWMTPSGAVPHPRNDVPKAPPVPVA